MQLIIVTPERAVLNQTTDFVVLPMFDGEHGVQKSHSAFVGQLGSGELRFTDGAETKRYFVDGGFVQVAKDVINILTPKAMPAADVSKEKAAALRKEADALPATNSVERATKARAIQRATGMDRVAGKK